MSDAENEYLDQLKTKRICRFCLTQDDQLSNIYSNENRKNSRAPLPLQIMACVSIEVSTYTQKKPKQIGSVFLFIVNI